MLVATHIYAQKHKCNCEAFLSTTFTGAEAVYNDADGQTELYAINNKPLNEDFTHLTILAQKGDMLQVAPFSIEQYYDTGWINNTNVAIYTKNYEVTVNLYKKASTASSVVSVVPVGIEPEYRVVGCKGGWLEVSYTNNEQTVSGWLAPQDQCGSAYVTCE